MKSLKTNNEEYEFKYDVLIRHLESTTEKVAKLLDNFQDSEVEIAVIKNELKLWIENVKELTSLIQKTDDGTSILTRIALLEDAVENLSKQLSDLLVIVKNENSKHIESPVLQAADKAGKWQMRVAMIAGGSALITSIITFLLNFISKH